MKISGPLFKWFGSKWLSSKKLPEPDYDTIVEPFAGGAGYSLRYYKKKVILCEKDPHISRLWNWLISHAKESDIREIPINIPEGTDIRKIGLSLGQQLLLKTWQRTNNIGDCWTISPWGNKPGQWTENTRARIASEFGAISHWKFASDDGLMFMRDKDFEATWFIDPPYEYNYQYKSALVNYDELSYMCTESLGQTIVCEAVCPKTNKVPKWLPFKFFGSRITSRRKKDNNHHSKELIWTNY
jgi:site-specific DNA-adenine methylase